MSCLFTVTAQIREPSSYPLFIFTEVLLSFTPPFFSSLLPSYPPSPVRPFKRRYPGAFTVNWVFLVSVDLVYKETFRHFLNVISEMKIFNNSPGTPTTVLLVCVVRSTVDVTPSSVLLLRTPKSQGHLRLRFETSCSESHVRDTRLLFEHKHERVQSYKGCPIKCFHTFITGWSSIIVKPRIYVVHKDYSSIRLEKDVIGSRVVYCLPISSVRTFGNYHSRRLDKEVDGSSVLESWTDRCQSLITCYTLYPYPSTICS